MTQSIFIVTNIYLSVFAFSYLIIKLVNLYYNPPRYDNIIETFDKYNDIREEIDNYEDVYNSTPSYVIETPNKKRRLLIRSSEPIFIINANHEKIESTSTL